MITIIYSTHKDAQYNAKFKEHLSKTIGVKEFEILEYINNNEYSLAQIYNKGIAAAKNNIIVCCHNDIKLENGWGKRLLVDFEANPEFAIIGKAGSCYFSESGVFWERMQQTMVGQVYHHPPGQKKWLSKYSAKYPFLIPVVTIDGLFMSFDKTKIKHTFDEAVGKFHFYDHGFCLYNHLSGVKIGVTSSFEITHESVGQPNSEFFETKDLFVKKWKYSLPIDLKPLQPYTPTENIKPIKNLGKVAVIIPTKSKLDLLFGCVNSIVNLSNEVNYEIFVADTGSSDEEINQIKTLISSLSNKAKINLIEYDYYNFARINNDVVKNQVDDTFTHVLFCNNDVVWLSNIMYHMLTIFKDKPLTGTVGGKLFFGDNTIQHDGMVLMKSNANNSIMPTHFNLYSYYGNNLTDQEVLGNTGALLMIRKNTFNKIGGFNEEYTTCFEDVELNIKCVVMGLKNIISSKSIAHHFESQTRTKEKHVLDMEMNDYYKLLLPCIQQNINKITKYMVNY